MIVNYLQNGTYEVDGHRLADDNFVRSLHVYSINRVAWPTLLVWLQLLAGWSLALLEGWYFPLLATIILISVQQQMSSWVHESSHFNLSSNRVLNDWWCTIFFASPIGMNLYVYRSNHLTHHAFLSTNRDRDEWVHAVDWSGLGIIRMIALNLICYYGVKIVRQKYLPAFNLRTPAKGSISSRNAERSLVAPIWHVIFAVLWNGVFFVFCIFNDKWYLYFVCWIYPLLSFSQLINFIRTSAEHQPMGFPRVTLAAQPIVRTTIPSLFEKWLMYGANFNYHLEHHLWPHVPFFNLPRLHAHMAERGYYESHRDLLQRSGLWRIWRLKRTADTTVSAFGT